MNYYVCTDLFEGLIRFFTHIYQKIRERIINYAETEIENKSFLSWI